MSLNGEPQVAIRGTADFCTSAFSSSPSPRNWFRLKKIQVNVLLFLPQSDQRFKSQKNLINNNIKYRKQQFFTFERLEPPNVSKCCFKNYLFDFHNSRIYSVKQVFVLVLLYFLRFYNFVLHFINYAKTNLCFWQTTNDDKLYLFISFSIYH